MAIAAYIREIGRGKEGARSLSREQACDLMGQVLDGHASDLEVGGFCLAMRIKGETATEMSGFLDAVSERLSPAQSTASATVVIPSYNGARRLPVLTPLLGLLLARAGLPVLIHGVATESGRVFIGQVLHELGIAPCIVAPQLDPGRLAFVPTDVLCPALVRLLEVRRVVGLRNPAHSLVKLLTPCTGPSILVTSYTHPEYAHSMAEVMKLRSSTGLLLRGTEGEAVADARRAPAMRAFRAGELLADYAAQVGTVNALPDWPDTLDANTTAAYIADVMAGRKPVPSPIALQVARILQLAAP